MIKFEILAELLLAREEKVNVQKVISKNKRVYNKVRAIKKETFVNKIVQLEEAGKEIEVWQENGQEWTVRAVDMFVEDTTEFKVKIA